MERAKQARSHRPRIEIPHEPIGVAPLRLALDDEVVAADRELIAWARVRDLARPHLKGHQRQRFGAPACILGTSGTLWVPCASMTAAGAHPWPATFGVRSSAAARSALISVQSSDVSRSSRDRPGEAI
jgi:hypothetical protein